MTWKIVLTIKAREMLEKIQDRRVREMIRDRINALSHNPEKQGKPLIGDLSGYRSLRTVGQRYRVIYHVEREKVVVLIVAIGMRKEGDKADIYALAKKLVRLGLVDLSP